MTRQLNRVLQSGCGLAGRVAEPSSFRYQPRVFDGARPIAALLKMMRELGRHFARICREDLLQPLPPAVVQLCPPSRNQPAIEGLPVQFVDKLVAPGHASVWQFLKCGRTDTPLPARQSFAKFFKAVDIHLRRSGTDR